MVPGSSSERKLVDIPLGGDRFSNGLHHTFQCDRIHCQNFLLPVCISWSRVDLEACSTVRGVFVVADCHKAGKLVSGVP